MANHRMFSNRIANSAKFLQMPSDSQLLYFHMVLRADDDGVVEAYPLMRLLGAGPDNFKVLAAKGFIKQLNEDQVVVITDWTEHNIIRADRKVNSIYLPLLIAAGIPVLPPKPRSDVEDNSKRLNGQSTDGLSKGKLSKDKIIKKAVQAPQAPNEVSEIMSLFREVNPSIGKFYGNTSQRAAIERMLKEHGREQLGAFIKALPTVNAKKFWPKSTTPCQLEDNLGKYKALNDEEKNGDNKKGLKVAYYE